ncbi:DnaJ-class molecular chaperone [Lipingzhangella halophila]|uniref:DnaJ-class molecular chaperone n=1 Tax=Lipingzhangella halophila TaxID=1783352 RepID=A0A7W7RHG1_9ACTN|nr:hypothetical protein [Lipingzhangella halophila]MBB4931972.1 DnaJ-class molecular chaperone [Lipingzhangella halophila]
MDIAIVCQCCQGSGLRVNVVGYSGRDVTGEMVVPRPCDDCDGSGRIPSLGWSSSP